MPTKIQYKPWTGNRDDLPEPKRDANKNVIKKGEKLYFANGNKLVAIYNTGKGIARKFVKSIKIPRKIHNDPDNSLRRRAIMGLRETLKKSGVPGL